MASEVDIANLALGYLGDRATVASLNPPEGSAQAEHCQRFYPIARDNLLEMHNWGFATRRKTLARLTSPASGWMFAYAKPADCMRALAILDPLARDDYSFGLGIPSLNGLTNDNGSSAYGQYTPQPFAFETLESGTEVILTNQDDAVLRYTARITDTTRFSPLFVNTLAWHLASMLAGPIIKGDAGQAEAKRCMQMVMTFLSQAKVSDANQRDVKPQHVVSWMAGR